MEVNRTDLVEVNHADLLQVVGQHTDLLIVVRNMDPLRSIHLCSMVLQHNVDGGMDHPLEAGEGRYSKVLV